MSLPEKNPWPGLLPYGEADAALFHGRAAEIDALLELVQSDALSVLYSVSGLGKTSLLQAGLFPRLREADALPVYVRLDLDTDWARIAQEWVRDAGEELQDAAADTPLAASLAAIRAKARRSMSERVFDDILDAFAEISGGPEREGVKTPESQDGDTLWEYFHRPGNRLWTADNHPLTPVLVFDQFEEIFTLGRHTLERARRVDEFLSELAELLANRPPLHILSALERGEEIPFDPRPVPLRVLLSLREDFLPHLSQLRERGFPTVRRRELRLEPLSARAACRVIEAPAPAIIAPGTSDALLDFLAGSAAADHATRDVQDSSSIEPALLSVVLHELFEKARVAGQPQLTPELLTGSRDEILDDFYERAFAGVDPAVRLFVERELLTPGGFRDTRAVEDATSRFGITIAALDTLVDRRLLRYEERAQGQRRIELTHDLLCGVVHGSKRRRDEIEAARALEKAQAAGMLRKRELRLRLARFYVLSIIVGIAVALGPEQPELKLFVVSFVTLWLGMLYGILNRSSDANVRNQWQDALLAFALTLSQGAILYLLARVSGGLDGSIGWQLAMLCGISVSGVSIGMLVRLFLAAPIDGLMIAGFLQFVLLLTSGYIVKPTEMRRAFKSVASLTPGYGAQVVMDSSFILDRPLIGEINEDHYQAIRNLNAGDPDNRDAEDRFVNRRPAIRGLITMLSYVPITILGYWWAGRLRGKDRTSEGIGSRRESGMTPTGPIVK